MKYILFNVNEWIYYRAGGSIIIKISGYFINSRFQLVNGKAKIGVASYVGGLSYRIECRGIDSRSQNSE
jgi:hypothetical protein